MKVKIEKPESVRGVMKTATVATKVNFLQACLDDLRERGIDHLVVDVHACRASVRPIINLREAPPAIPGARVIRFRTRSVMGATHLGCQLRWGVQVS